ncbi:MAG TPA: lactonase family protein [Puia sp.]|nr:lactonase family protein [Puia sp.]
MIHAIKQAILIYLVIGSYTKPGEKGVSVYTFDTRTGDLQFKSATGGIDNPSYLTIGKNGKNIYAVSEKNGGPGSVYAYQFDQSSGTLNLINQAPSGGKGPCYISVDNAGTHVFTANYGSGSLGVIGLKEDGSLDTAALQSIQHTGSSIKADQTRPHAHSAILSPDDRYVLSANLGNDHIYIYRFDPKAREPLTPADPAYVTVTPGSGPRHITFHPNGRYVYVLNEISGSIDGYDYKDGVLTHKQTITILPEGFTGTVEAADIHISPDGKFLYASNREDRNELVIYSITPTGQLNLAGRQPVLGIAPRGFNIDPSGKFVLVANLKTNEVLVFLRSTKTGLLTFTGKKISVTQPACLKFVSSPS